MQDQSATTAPRADNIQPLAYSVRTAIKAAGGVFGRDKLLELIDAGAIPARRCGSKIAILSADLRAYLENLPPYRKSDRAA